MQGNHVLASSMIPATFKTRTASCYASLLPVALEPPALAARLDDEVLKKRMEDRDDRVWYGPGMACGTGRPDWSLLSPLIRLWVLSNKINRGG